MRVFNNVHVYAKCLFLVYFGIKQKKHSVKTERKITAFFCIDQLYLPQSGIDTNSGQKVVKNGSKMGQKAVMFISTKK